MLKVQFNFKHFFVILAITSFLLSSFFVFYSKTFAATGINRTINFQGKLVNNPAATNVADTTYTVVFTLYNNPTAGQGTALWTETQTVTTVDGIFRVALGSVTPLPANFNFNWDGLYLGIKVNSDSEMTPRVQMAAVPFAFNAEKVAGLTVQDTSGNASTSGTLQVANAKTVSFGGAFSTTAGNDVAFTTGGTTTLTLPTTGTLLTNTTTANQTITSTQTTGTVLGVTDSTGLTGAITGMAITLSGTGVQDQTGLSFNLSGASGTNLNDIVGTGSSWKISKGGALTVASCSGCGGGGTNFWGSVGGLNYPLDTRSDLAIGATSTTSALFSFTGIKTGLTIASASGSLIIMPNNGWGQVGIGTTTPITALDVKGTIRTSNASPISTFLMPDTGASGGYQTGTGQNLYFDGSNWRTKGDGGNNGGVAMINNYGASTVLRFIVVNSTGGSDNVISNASLANYEWMRLDGSGNLGVGTNAPVATLSVSGHNGLNAAAIINQLNSGNILSASASGATKFVITNGGAINLVGGQTSDIDTLSATTLNIGATNATTLSIGRSGQGITLPGFSNCTLKTSSGALQCGTDLQGGGGGTSYIDQNNGLTYIGNVTTDFAIGGTSTGAAKFIFGVGTNGSIPTATFSGALMMEAQANSNVTDQTNWQQISGTAGTLGGGTGSIASISAMASYNGSLYVGTTNIVNGAEVYRYDNGTSWTRVSNASAGSIDGVTIGIASVSAMTVYDGYLYVGTSKMNQAEVYRYNGGSSWSKVSGPAAGTFGSVTAVDGVASLAVYQGTLYAGLREFGGARLMVWGGGITWTALNNTAGTFVATNTVGQHSVDRLVVKNGALYMATRKDGDADVLRYAGGNSSTSSYYVSMNLASTTGSYLINGTAVTGVNEITAMTVFNGAVIVAIRRGIGQADVMSLNDSTPTGGGATSPNSWTRLNAATGQMAAGAGETTSIDSVSALAVYKGVLYAGTQDPPGTGEIYKYVGGDKKFIKVSQATAGQLAPGGTTGIAGVANLIPINDDLYAGTNDGITAEVYKLANVNVNKSYSLEFHAAPSVAGGEQGVNENLASIFFLASASANLSNSAANTGAFIFSHGIQTRNGSYDVAEDYPTRDNSLEAGDVVAIDPNERGFVKKTSEAYDHDVLGVFSSNPALRLTQADALINGGTAVPIALAGRVPVKVSTESGEIKPGDYLTPSSTAGVAMKASKSSVVFAQAMEGYSGEGVGKVLSYIKSMTYEGSIADNFANLDTNAPNFAVNVLDRLKTQNTTDGKSSVITDRLIAGLEVITPKISAEKVNLNEINVLSGSDVTLNLSQDGKFIVENASGSAAITFDSEGNAYFSGLVFANKIKANQIEGLEIFTNRLSSLDKSIASLSGNLNSAVLGTSTENIEHNSSLLTLLSLNVEGLATISADLNVKGSGIFERALTVLDSIATQNLIVSNFATFFNDVVFKGNIRFNQAPTFSSDTAGFAVIKQGDDKVEVVFGNEYSQIPIVTASIVLDKVGDSVLQKQLEDSVLSGGVSYVITQRTTKGFVIKLNKSTDKDLNFSWVALSVNKAKTWGSTSYQIPTPTPSLLPLPSATATPSAAVQSILNQLNGLTGNGGG